MYAKNTSIEDLEKALKIVNEQFDNNVAWEQEPNWKGKRLIFTLRTKNSRGKGAYITIMNRHIPKACWHVHGEFFDTLFEINSKAIIQALGRNIDRNGGNWVDSNIGPPMNPKFRSECCDCE